MNDLQDTTLPLYCNGKHAGTIPLREAVLSAKHGDIELVWKGRGRKARITAAHLVVDKGMHPSPCTITRAEVENNAFVHTGARLSEKDSMGALDRAVAKVEAWPSVHDDRAPVISAGKAYGVILCHIPAERVVTFA